MAVDGGFREPGEQNRHRLSFIGLEAWNGARLRRVYLAILFVERIIEHYWPKSPKLKSPKQPRPNLGGSAHSVSYETAALEGPPCRLGYLRAFWRGSIRVKWRRSCFNHCIKFRELGNPQS